MYPDYRDSMAGAPSEADAALLGLSLDELEEAGGELHRRIAAGLRALGEQAADVTPPGGRSPRWQVAALAAASEAVAMTLGAVAARLDAGTVPRTHLHAATIAAVMYAAPSLSALLNRLEQDRRLVVSLARSLEAGLDGEHATAWGRMPLRALVGRVIVLEAARCAMSLEQAVPPE